MCPKCPVVYTFWTALFRRYFGWACIHHDQLTDWGTYAVVIFTLPVSFRGSVLLAEVIFRCHRKQCITTGNLLQMVVERKICLRWWYNCDRRPGIRLIQTMVLRMVVLRIMCSHKKKLVYLSPKTRYKTGRAFQQQIAVAQDVCGWTS